MSHRADLRADPGLKTVVEYMYLIKSVHKLNNIYDWQALREHEVRVGVFAPNTLAEEIDLEGNCEFVWCMGSEVGA